MIDAALLQFFFEVRGIGGNHLHPIIMSKLLADMLGKNRVDLHQEQTRVGMHLFDNLPTVNTFARPEFHDDPRLGKITFCNHPPDQRLGTGKNVGNPEGLCQKSLKQ